MESNTAARKRARAEEERLANGVDPREVRRQEQERARVAQLNTLELTARAWHAQAKKDRQWSEGYAKKVIRPLELHVFPWLGERQIDKILPTELVACLHRIKDRGNLETAQRAREAAQQVFQYAVDVGALEPAKNFVNNRTGGLPPPRARHFAAITDPSRLAQLLRDIQGYKGHILTRAALRLMPMLFQRPGQLRLAHWEDLNFDHQLWRCPPENMKMREIYPLTGPTGPIFRNMAKRSETSRYMTKTPSTVQFARWATAHQAGAGGIIGTEYTLAANDGHTLLMASPSMLLAKYTTRDVRFDPLTDLTPVYRVFNTPVVFVTSAKTAQHAKTMAELVALSKSSAPPRSFPDTGRARGRQLCDGLLPGYPLARAHVGPAR